MLAVHYKGKLVAQGAIVVGSTPEQLVAFSRAETARWGAVIARAGIRLD